MNTLYSRRTRFDDYTPRNVLDRVAIDEWFDYEDEEEYFDYDEDYACYE